MIPTNPAARGIVPVATATVCKMTFSCGVNGFDTRVGKTRGMNLKMAKPSRADCSDIIDTHPGNMSARLPMTEKVLFYPEVPVCKPK
jgi:hypothetical protein